MTRRAIVRRLLVGTVLGIVVLAALAAGAKRLARSRTHQLFGRLVSRVETTQRVVALTFDDGPAPAVADTLLAVLRARGVRVTFFVMGVDLAREPAIARRMVAEGHELANHTYTHRRMVLVSSATVSSEVGRTDSLIRAAGWRGPILFRPPYGYKLVALPRHLAREGRTTVTWDVEPDSYPDVAASPERIVRHVLDRARPGSIILLHPWYPSRATSLAAVGPLVDSLHARGYRVVPVGELLGAHAPASR
jgi:peptidoglycan-N-acetylglucosamine deacetylase